MQDKVDGEENARLGEKNSKLAERILGSKKPKKNIERGINHKSRILFPKIFSDRFEFFSPSQG